MWYLIDAINLFPRALFSLSYGDFMCGAFSFYIKLTVLHHEIVRLRLQWHVHNEDVTRLDSVMFAHFSQSIWIMEINPIEMVQLMAERGFSHKPFVQIVEIWHLIKYKMEIAADIDLNTLELIDI